MKKILALWNEEPVRVQTWVTVTVALGASFGLELTAQQVGAVSAFTAATLGLVVRRKVTPA